MLCRLGRDGGMHRHHVGRAQQVVERVGGVGGVGIGGDHRHAQSLQAPLGGPAHGAQSHQSGNPSRHLPGPVALVGEGLVEHGSGPHVAVSRDHEPVHRHQQRHRHLGHRVGVATRCTQHRDAGRSGRVDVHVVGSAPGGSDGGQRQLQHRTLARVGLAHDDVGPFGLDLCREVVGSVQLDRLVFDPRFEHHIGDIAQLLKGGAPKRSSNQHPSPAHKPTLAGGLNDQPVNLRERPAERSQPVRG